MGAGLSARFLFARPLLIAVSIERSMAVPESAVLEGADLLETILKRDPDLGLELRRVKDSTAHVVVTRSDISLADAQQSLVRILRQYREKLAQGFRYVSLEN